MNCPYLNYHLFGMYNLLKLLFTLVYTASLFCYVLKEFNFSLNYLCS